jgi:hypothetical protein
MTTPTSSRNGVSLSHAEAMDLMAIQRLSYRATALKEHLNENHVWKQRGDVMLKEVMLDWLNRNSSAKHEAEANGDRERLLQGTGAPSLHRVGLAVSDRVHHRRREGTL